MAWGPVDALVARVRLTAGHDAAVLLMPHEALALVAEVERERAAVVAWLREHDADEFAASEHADFIERGEHRREEGER